MHAGEYIIASQPDAVVVETAVGPEHGALPGNVLTCGDQVVDSNAAFYLRMFCQVRVHGMWMGCKWDVNGM